MTQEAGQQDVTGARQRTRRAIVDAAIAAWARDFSAPLGDIADRAAVSRSTLHRYFPERQALVDAAFDDALATLDRESARAVAGCSTAGEELEALMRVLIDVSDALVFLFADPNRFSGDARWNEAEDDNLVETITRAQAEGSIDPEPPAPWVVGVFYSLCYVAGEAIAAGELPRHRAADTAVRTFLRGLGAAAHEAG